MLCENRIIFPTLYCSITSLSSLDSVVDGNPVTNICPIFSLSVICSNVFISIPALFIYMIILFQFSKLLALLSKLLKQLRRGHIGLTVYVVAAQQINKRARALLNWW